MRNEKIIKEFQEEVEKMVEAAIENNTNPAKRVGMLANVKQFDPDDPEVIVSGFGTWTRSSLRMAIVNRLEGLLRQAKSGVNQDGPAAYMIYKNMIGLLHPKFGVVYRLIQAEMDVADELEALRKKGGRRDFIIPKQK